MTARSNRGSPIPAWQATACQKGSADFHERKIRGRRDGSSLETVTHRHYLAVHPFAGETSMAIQVGDRIPDVQLTLATPEGPVPAKRRRLFRRQARCAVRGTGSLHADLLRPPPAELRREGRRAEGQGHRRNRRTSVNDAFVMGAWNRDQGIGPTPRCWPTAMASSAEAVGLTMDASKFGMGKRSQRYSMLSTTASSNKSTSRRPANIQPPAPRRCWGGPSFKRRRAVLSSLLACQAETSARLLRALKPHRGDGEGDLETMPNRKRRPRRPLRNSGRKPSSSAEAELDPALASAAVRCGQ